MLETKHEGEFQFDIYSNGYNGANLIINSKIQTEGKDKVYCHEPYAQQLYNLYTSPSKSFFIKKDLLTGDIMLIKEFKHLKDYDVLVTLINGISFKIDLTKEDKFINLYGFTPDQFINAIEITPNLDGECYACCLDNKSGRYSLWEGHLASLRKEFDKQIINPTTAYTAKINDINGGGFFVDIQGVDAYLPGSLAAANIVTDFNAMLGQEIIVMVENYVPKMRSYIVSHKKYIKYALASRIKELVVGNLYTGKITGSHPKIGIFVEIDGFFTGLIHPSKMGKKMEENYFLSNYKPGESIEVILDEIEDGTNKIMFRDPLWEPIPESEKEKVNENIKPTERKPRKIIKKE